MVIMTHAQLYTGGLKQAQSNIERESIIYTNRSIFNTYVIIQ